MSFRSIQPQCAEGLEKHLERLFLGMVMKEVLRNTGLNTKIKKPVTKIIYHSQQSTLFLDRFSLWNYNQGINL